MNKILLCKSILLNLRKFLSHDKLSGLLLLILPFWILYTIYATYYDETTKNAVIVETEQIRNYIGGDPVVEYKGKEKIISFYSEIYIHNNDRESINKYRNYLSENGYKKIDDTLWVKGKYSISENYDGEYTIINIEYIKDKPQ